MGIEYGIIPQLCQSCTLLDTVTSRSVSFKAKINITSPGLLFRPRTAILSAMTRLSLTRSLHGLEIMMGRLVFTFVTSTQSREILKTSFEGSGRRPSYPKSIAGLEVSSIVDLTLGYDSTNPPTYKPILPLSSGHMIQFRAASSEGLKIVLTTRTSGTEPKVRMKGLLVR